MFSFLKGIYFSEEEVRVQLLTLQPSLKWFEWYPLVICTCLKRHGVGPLSELSQGRK